MSKNVNLIALLEALTFKRLICGLCCGCHYSHT